jgi:hypothetical protein
MELESNISSSFHDCNVTKSNDRFQTSVYRKSTFIGLSTSFFSFCSFRFKLNGIQTLINQGFRICSTFHTMRSEFEFLRSKFSLNGFPSQLVYTKIKVFLSEQYSEVVPERDDRNAVYCSFPYFGPASESMAKELRGVFSKHLPNVNLHVLLVNNFKIIFFHV